MEGYVDFTKLDRDEIQEFHRRLIHFMSRRFQFSEYEMIRDVYDANNGKLTQDDVEAKD